jgi:hypothetical protein
MHSNTRMELIKNRNKKIFFTFLKVKYKGINQKHIIIGYPKSQGL